MFGYVSAESVMLTKEDGSALEVQVGLYIALLELSCGKIEVLTDHFYIY